MHRRPQAAAFLLNTPQHAEIYTLSLHDALPISVANVNMFQNTANQLQAGIQRRYAGLQDRKSTRLNSSHRCISYAVFCLKKKKQTQPGNQEWSQKDQSNGQYAPNQQSETQSDYG